MGVKLNLKGLSKVSSSISSLSEPEENDYWSSIDTYTTSAIACTAHAHEQSSPVQSPVQSPGFALAQKGEPVQRFLWGVICVKITMGMCICRCAMCICQCATCICQCAMCICRCAMCNVHMPVYNVYNNVSACTVRVYDMLSYYYKSTLMPMYHIIFIHVPVRYMRRSTCGGQRCRLGVL